MTGHSDVRSSDPYENVINVRDWARLAWRRRRLIAGTACAGMLVGAAIALVTPRISVATSRLIVGQDISSESPPAILAKYRLLLDEPLISQQVVAELGLEKPPYGLSAARFQSEALASTAVPAGIQIEVRHSDASMAVRAANAVARHTVELARRREERSRILDDISPVLKLKLELPDLLANIKTEETGLRVLDEQLRGTSFRAESLQRDRVLRRVRLAQLREKWDQINAGLQIATEIVHKLTALSPTDPLPPEVLAGLKSLDHAFAVAPGVRREVQPPLRVVAEATTTGPSTWSIWGRYLMLGFTLGLMLPLTGTAVEFVLSAGRLPDPARATPE